MVSSRSSGVVDVEFLSAQRGKYLLRDSGRESSDSRGMTIQNKERICFIFIS